MAHITREAPGPFPYSERHLQCVWYDAALRPAAIATHDGQGVTVIDPGRWNLEAGPDFLDARLETASGARRGDVEIHIRPQDWVHHGHSADPNYANVAAHVSYYETSIESDLLPDGALQIGLESQLDFDSGFSFESIDISAYPYSAHPLATAIAEEVSTWHPDEIEGFLDAAGAERIRLKAEALRISIASLGADQAVYSTLMGALGYKNNAAAMRLLANRVPALELYEETEGDPQACYAVLMAVSGLLPEQLPAPADRASRGFIRGLWNVWWKQAEPWNDRTLSESIWKLGGLRPPNHPRRRLAAAASLICQNPRMGEVVESFSRNSAEEWLHDAKAWLHISGPIAYWRNHLSLGGNIHPRGVALIGQGRAAAIISNLLIPYVALHDAKFAEEQLLRHLPAEEDNTLIRQAALNLLGHDHNPAMYHLGLRQQGLIQIFLDEFLGA
ncbi:MAG: DUF2851 family protein [Verrucomicrobia bacterium]|nr:DUF2851 family protein [Verrucomicrobiota bacterium]MDA1088272.1 DUF2851 family protein [Verrucomicrobiota bacterium]